LAECPTDGTKFGLSVCLTDGIKVGLTGTTYGLVLGWAKGCLDEGTTDGTVLGLLEVEGLVLGCTEGSYDG
jgi:hypothetical protein